MNIADATAGLPTRKGPRKDPTSKPVPDAIADVLVIVRILLAYGRQLSETLEQRATGRGFSVIAQFFGTARVSVILARLSRGILRAIALERVLLARAARGRDLVRFQPRWRPGEREAQPAGQQQKDDQQQGEKKPPVRRPAPEPLPEFPTLEQLVEDTRRHPTGRAIADICRDLGVASDLCEGWFGTVLYQAIDWYRGNFYKYYKDILARKIEFSKEWDQDNKARFDWPEPTREGIHRVLGFFIGENVLAPGPAPLLPGLAEAATGPAAGATGPAAGATALIAMLATGPAAVATGPP